MPWCPKCRNEYRKGITVCAECKVELVDSLENSGKQAFYFLEKRIRWSDCSHFFLIIT